MTFEFATATRIIFGAGKIEQAGILAHEFGRHAMVVTGRDAGRAQRLLESLKKQGIGVVLFQVEGEPDLERVGRGLAMARRERCDLVIAMGGGSALDMGKAIAVMLTNDGDVLDYLEVIGGGKTLQRSSAPFVAIPTTAGTGSEVTRNAVFTSVEHRVKASLRSPFMLPKVALVDPELTRGLPPAVIAGTGLDALTQLIEPYVCLRANALADVLCEKGIHAARSLRAAWENGGADAAREDMALASLLGGLALSNAGLGAVHGLAGAIGGMLPAPHGAICGILLPEVMRANLAALSYREPSNPAIRKYEKVAQGLTGQNDAPANDGVEWVRQLASDLQVPRLGRYGLTHATLAEVVEKATHANSMKSNPIALTSRELVEILEEAI